MHKTSTDGAHMRVFFCSRSRIRRPSITMVFHSLLSCLHVAFRILPLIWLPLGLLCVAIHAGAEVSPAARKGEPEQRYDHGTVERSGVALIAQSFAGRFSRAGHPACPARGSGRHQPNIAITTQKVEPTFGTVKAAPTHFARGDGAKDRYPWRRAENAARRSVSNSWWPRLKKRTR